MLLASRHSDESIFFRSTLSLAKKVVYLLTEQSYKKSYVFDCCQEGRICQEAREIQSNESEIKAARSLKKDDA